MAGIVFVLIYISRIFMYMYECYEQNKAPHLKTNEMTCGFRPKTWNSMSAFSRQSTTVADTLE